MVYLTEEHEAFRGVLRTYFERNSSIERVAEWDRSETFPESVYQGLSELGVLGLTFPEEYGGQLADEFTICVTAEELARAGGVFLYTYMPTITFCAKAVYRFGTEAQRRSILPEVAAGRCRFAMGLSEPDAGSDLFGLKTRAVPDGEEWIVRGQKVFTTGADTANFILLLVRTSLGAPTRQALTFLLIPPSTPGVTVRPLRKLAGQGTHTCEVFLDDVRVTRDAVLGGEEGIGRGAQMVGEMLNAARIYVGAQGIGHSQRALDWARDYALERVQFGKPIASHQAVAHMLAQMDIDTEATRQLVYSAAWLLEQGLPCSRESAMAKVFASEAASRTISKGMQILGGYSYIVDFGMERLYRECKLNEIAGGTNEILRTIVAQKLGCHLD